MMDHYVRIGYGQRINCSEMKLQCASPLFRRTDSINNVPRSSDCKDISRDNRGFIADY